MKFKLDKLSPWAEITTCFQQMRALEVKIGGKTYRECEADISLDRGTGIATLEVCKAKRKVPKQDEIAEAMIAANEEAPE